MMRAPWRVLVVILALAAAPAARGQYPAPGGATPRDAALRAGQASRNELLRPNPQNPASYAGVFPNYGTSEPPAAYRESVPPAPPAPTPRQASYTGIFPNYAAPDAVLPPTAGHMLPARPGDVAPLPATNYAAVPGATMSALPPAAPTAIGATSSLSAAVGNCAGDNCCTPCAPLACPWFGGVAGLLMGRDSPNNLWLTTGNNFCGCHKLSAQQAYSGAQGGADFRFGRYFGNPANGIGGAALAGGGFGGAGAGYGGGWAMEAVYWALAPMNGYASVSAESPTDLLSSLLQMDTPPVPTIGPYTASDYFNNALQQEVWRRDFLQSLELNFWRLPVFTPTQRMQVNWMGGIRFLRFTEELIYGSVSASTTYPEIYGAEGFLNTKVITNLVGAQIGARGNFFLTRRLTLYAQPTMGVFGAQMQSRMRLYDSLGNEGFDNRGNLNDVSLLGQIDAGTQWFITPRWSLFAAYRVLGITGVALADNQIPPALNDTMAMRDVHSNGSLIVAGGVFGTMFAY